METKYKIDDTLYFIGSREIFEGPVKEINIRINKKYGTSIIYTIDTYEGEQKVIEENLFKSRIECAMSLLCDSADKINVEKKNGEYIFKVKEEDLYENE